MDPGPSRIRLVHVFTVPITIGFLRGALGYLTGKGFEVHCIVSPGPGLEAFAVREPVAIHTIPMTRRISPARDILALLRIARELLLLRPDVVHGSTPKGALLGMLAACLTRIPVRVYEIRGLPFLTATGLRRRLLRWTEKLTCALAHRVVCDSNSMLRIAVDEGFCTEGKGIVLLNGSCNGVDAAERFNPERYGPAIRSETRRCHGVPDDAMILGFVGRLVKDKGVVDLWNAWLRLRESYPGLHLLLVGDFESEDAVPATVSSALSKDQRVHITGWLDEVAPFYAAMDLLVLPTYREGFPYAPLEAAAMGVPVVATRIPGCTDVVQDGVTGVLVSTGDVDALTGAITAYLDDDTLRLRHGQAGRERALRDFRPEAMWKAYCDEYVRLLEQRRG